MTINSVINSVIGGGNGIIGSVIGGISAPAGFDLLIDDDNDYLIDDDKDYLFG
jgi:hypothetical protein